MSLTHWPIDNSIDGEIENLHAAATPAVPITDAVMTWTLYDSSGEVVTGCDAVAMPHVAAGLYRGSAMPTSSLTINAKYRMTISCSNYDASWTEWKRAMPRGFED
jgi:hypothetical protein